MFSNKIHFFENYLKIYGICKSCGTCFLIDVSASTAHLLSAALMEDSIDLQEISSDDAQHILDDDVPVPNTNPFASATAGKKGKNWCLTINSKHNEDLSDQIAQFTVQKSHANYYVYGREKAKTGMFFLIIYYLIYLI